MIKCKKVLAVLLLIILSSSINAARISVSPILSSSAYYPEDTVTVAFVIEIPEKYHLYSNPLGPGIGKDLEFSISSNSKNIEWFEATQKQPKKYTPIAGDWVWAWEEYTVLFAKGVIKESASNEFTDTIFISGLMCSESCILQNETLPVKITVGENNSNSSYSDNLYIKEALKKSISLPFSVNGDIVGDADIETESGGEALGQNSNSNVLQESDFKWNFIPVENVVQYNIFLAIILAFIAGIILNFMPCVLPVLGIKILSFSKGKGQSKKTRIISSAWFSLGMIGVFLLLATLAVFAGMSWGQQFQSPLFIIILVSLMFIFGLGMFDLFIMLVPTKIGEMEQTTKNGIWGDIARGMFATLLATPCSGPFLGATLAWTLTQPPIIVYAIFSSLGLGMASPYILLSASDKLLKIIPKPGAWMEDFKHLMGFFLFGFAVYLMIGLPSDKILPLLGFLVVIAFSLVVYKRFSPFGSSLRRKLTVLSVIAIILGYGWHLNFGILYGLISQDAAQNAEVNSDLKWVDFSKEKLFEANKNGQSVIVDFTANWCMNCQFNKIHVYHSKEVEELLKEKNILAMKGDITVSNPEVESLLHHLGSRSVPFLAIFPGDDSMHPIVMRDIVKKEKVISVLKRLEKF